MKLAQRLMHKHNLSQAVLLQERDAKNKHGGSAEEILKGGMVKVSIANRKTGNPAQFARWISHLTNPVSENFGVKSYHVVRRGRKCQVVFYGIYTNAQLAGYAFRVATERIAQMTAEYTPVTKYAYGRRSSPKSSKLSYALGIVKGISDDVDRNIKLEKERRQRNLLKARLSVSTGEAYNESDEEGGLGGNATHGGHESDNDGPSFSIFHAPPASGNGHTGISSSNNLGEDDSSVDLAGSGAPGQAKQSTTAGGAVSDRLKELEKEEQAAIVLVDHGQKVAEQVLEEHGVKLSSGRKRKAINFCRDSYAKGVEDSKEIDINQRALRHETRVKKEEKT